MRETITVHTEQQRQLLQARLAVIRVVSIFGVLDWFCFAWGMAVATAPPNVLAIGLSIAVPPVLGFVGRPLQSPWLRMLCVYQAAMVFVSLIGIIILITHNLRDATPIWLMGIGAAMAILTGAVWGNLPRIVIAGTCKQCGYALRGLQTPRCPECGTEFSPLDVED